MIQNLKSSQTKTVDTESVSKPCENVIRKLQKPLIANLNQQQQEEVKVKNPSSSKASVLKVVGSVRFEKACDSTIGKRQKRKAMSFRLVGSRSLAILKVGEKNHKWLDIWFPKRALGDFRRAANDPCESEELERVA